MSDTDRHYFEVSVHPKVHVVHSDNEDKNAGGSIVLAILAKDPIRRILLYVKLTKVALFEAMFRGDVNHEDRDVLNYLRENGFSESTMTHVRLYSVGTNMYAELFIENEQVNESRTIELKQLYTALIIFFVARNHKFPVKLYAEPGVFDLVGNHGDELPDELRGMDFHSLIA